MTQSTLKNEEAARTLRALLRDVIEQGALEVHFEWHPELQKTLCLIRVDGELRKHTELPAGIHSQLVARRAVRDRQQPRTRSSMSHR